MNSVLYPATEIQLTELPLTTALSEKTMSFPEWKDILFNKIKNREMTAGLIKDAFERIVRDIETIKKDLSTRTYKNAELEKYANTMRTGVPRAELVTMVARQMVIQFAFLASNSDVFVSHGYRFNDSVNSIRKALRNFDDQCLEEYCQRQDQKAAEHTEKMAKIKQAISNPQTLEDFELLIKLCGTKALTPEHIVKRDELIALDLLKKSKASAIEKKSVEPVFSTSTMSIQQTTHSKNGYPLFVVKMENRVERSEYDRLLAAAKKLGGWYSSFSRDGAIPGFQFKKQEDAQLFFETTQGKKVDVAERVEVEQAEKSSHSADHLLTAAAKLEESANRLLSANRLTNTHRRAAMASNAESRANADLAIARTMKNIAHSIVSGTAVHLESIRDKTQVEMLQRFIRRAKEREISASTQDYQEVANRKAEPATIDTVQHVRFPSCRLHNDIFADLIRKLKSLQGCIRLGQQLASNYRIDPEKNHLVVIPTEMMEAVDVKLKAHNVTDFWHYTDELANIKRLRRMGITTIEQLRAACREFVLCQVAQAGPDKVKMLERALIGSKVGIDFFPSPKNAVREWLEWSGIKPGMTCCESSAGNGNIAEVLREAGIEPDCLEISGQLREILSAKKFKLVGNDFLEYYQKYDAFLINPPFGNGQDMVHVRHAYALLNEAGILVSVVGEGAFFRTGKAETEFRQWLEDVGAEVKELPPGTFSDRNLMATTNTNARIVKIIKKGGIV